MFDAKLVRLGFPDSNIRTNVGRQPCSSTVETRLREELARRIGSVIRALGADFILAPLAIGAHADHEHCKAAALECCGSETLIFYEELP
jgi:LmbE family N-acetylglucosaminyl deacetylase